MLIRTSTQIPVLNSASISVLVWLPKENEFDLVLIDCISIRSQYDRRTTQSLMLSDYEQGSRGHR